MALELGSLDRLISIVGARGTGKSTYAIADLWSFGTRAGGYKLATTPDARIPTELPDGRKIPIRWYDTTKALGKGLRKAPGDVHALVTDEPEALITWARALARDVRRRAIKDAGHRFRERRPVPKGVKAPPVLMLIDEGTAIDEISEAQKRRATDPTARLTPKEWDVFLTGLRHEHIGMSWLIQAPTARSWRLIEQSNRIVVFRYTHEWGLNAIRAAGVPHDDIARIQQLPKFSHRVYDI